jgi:hypothetical protein
LPGVTHGVTSSSSPCITDQFFIRNPVLIFMQSLLATASGLHVWKSNFSNCELQLCYRLIHKYYNGHIYRHDVVDAVSSTRRFFLLHIRFMRADHSAWSVLQYGVYHAMALLLTAIDIIIIYLTRLGPRSCFTWYHQCTSSRVQTIFKGTSQPYHLLWLVHSLPCNCAIFVLPHLQNWRQTPN